MNPTTNSLQSNHELRPFGEECFEREFQKLGQRYKDYFFNHAPFNPLVLQEKVYLIIGRRGSGKSSLAHYFTFQNRIPNCRCVDVDEPIVFQNVLEKLTAKADIASAMGLPQIVRVWESIIWHLVFHTYRNYDDRIKRASLLDPNQGSICRLIVDLLKKIASKLIGDPQEDLALQAEKMLESASIKDAQDAVLMLLKKEPVIIAIDTLEQYDTSNHHLMWAVAALIECAAKFNTKYAAEGLHVKVFVAAEACTCLYEGYISNILKYVRSEIYMHWRPKELLRLLCWRFFKFLEDADLIKIKESDIDWDSYHDVYNRIWKPHFGEMLTNGLGKPEPTFPYLIRHTQNRPRQLIEICNEIASKALKNCSFPHFKEGDIVTVVEEEEVKLAQEIVNSYSQIYPNAGKIIDAMSGSPALFPGRMLDKWAHRTAALWPDNTYSAYAFRQLAVEMGIVGKVRKKDEYTKIVQADFEYFMRDRLPVVDSDECAVHPMFYRRLNIDVSDAWRVYPFPDHPDYKDINDQI